MKVFNIKIKIIKGLEKIISMQDKIPKNILFFILVISFMQQISGQQYQITYTGSADIPAGVCSPHPIDYARVRVYVEDDTQSVLLLEAFNGAPDSANDDEVLLSFKPNKIRYEEYILCDTGISISDYTTNTDIFLGHCDSESESYSFADISFDIEPIINISSASLNPVSACNNIVLNASDPGFQTSIYNWQYSTDGGVSWSDIPEHQGQSDIEVGIGGLPGLNVNETVHFRINHCGSVPTQVIILSFSDCSPGIMGDPVITLPDCSYSSDGYFTIYFDRDLMPGEEINFNLYQGAMGGEAPLYTQDNINTLGEGNSYTWPAVLASDTYYLQYQSNPTGSLTGFTEITITAPDTLTFSAGKAVDVSCFGGNDGSIDISSVSGGTGTYYYILNGNPPVEFTSPYTLDNLSPGDYNIQVTDSNDCTGNYNTPQETIAITINQPAAALSIEGIVSDATGFGLATGAIDITVSGGTGPYSFSWTKTGDPGFSQSTEDIASITAGEYHVQVIDANGCDTISDFTVNEPPPLIITIDAYSGVSCFGATDGSISASASGGYPNYHYELFREETPGNFISTGNILITAGGFSADNLIPGNYRITLTDNGGAGIQTLSDIVIIEEPTELAIATNAIVNVNCTGESTGSIDISVSGGTSPYTYSWNGGAYTAEDISNIAAGVYTLTVSDANGCVTPVEFFEITQPAAALSVSSPAASDIQHPTFAGASDGHIDITVSGGTGPYSFSWTKTGDPGFSQSTEDIASLSEGEYQVEVTDANGCIAMENYTLTEPEPLDAAIVEEQFIICNGDNTGQLSVNATGGVTTPASGYDFLWTKTGDPAFSQTTQSISNLNAGEYHVEVTDNNGITFSTSYVLADPALLSFNYNQTDNLCYGASQGNLELLPAGGVPPYSYSIDGVTFQPDPLFSDLPAGSYTLVVTDANGCSVSQPAAITSPEELLASSVVGQISAFGADDGSISLTVFGGTGPYSFEWLGDNGFFSTDEDIIGLEPGTYMLTVTDAGYAASGDDPGCSYMEEFVIIEPGALTVNIIEDFSLACFGDSNGELFADVSGGIAPYQYEWFSVEGAIDNFIGQTLDYATGLSAGDYRVRITDNNGNQILSEVYTLTQPELLIIQPETITDVICHGDATGAIDVSVLGGTPPYDIDWDNDEVSEDITGLEAGLYTLTVSDVNGCTAMEIIEVVNLYDPLSIDNVNITDVSSYLEADGSIAVTVSGGALPRNIEWLRLSDGALVGNTEIIANLTADDYQITITDDNGCVLTDTYTVTQPDIVTVEITPPSCFGSCDGSIALTPNVPAMLTYLWNTGSAENSINGLCAGSYSVTISGFGPPVERIYEVVNPELLQIDLGADRTLCKDQVIDLSAAIEDGGAVYSWTATNGFVSDQPVINVSQAGTYSVTVINSNGCQATDEIVIQTTDQEIEADMLVASQAFVGEPLVMVDVSVPVPDQVEWILPAAATVIAQDQDFAEIVFDTPGEYQVGIITRRGDCQAMQLKTVLVIEGEDFPQDPMVSQNNAIEEFIVYPNPSNGNFSVQVTLKNPGSINIKVFGLANNMLLADVSANDTPEYEIPFDLAPLTSGLYAVVLETPFGSQVRKIIVE